MNNYYGEEGHLSRTGDEDHILDERRPVVLAQRQLHWDTIEKGMKRKLIGPIMLRSPMLKLIENLSKTSNIVKHMITLFEIHYFPKIGGARAFFLTPRRARRRHFEVHYHLDQSVQRAPLVSETDVF